MVRPAGFFSRGSESPVPCIGYSRAPTLIQNVSDIGHYQTQQSGIETLSKRARSKPALCGNIVSFLSISTPSMR